MATYLICYDISDNRTRSRVSRLLAQHGQRVQESVFEVHRLDSARRRQLARQLATLVDDGADVRFYRLTADGIADSSDLRGAALARRAAAVIH